MAGAKNTKMSCVNVELYEKKEGKLGKMTELSVDTAETGDKSLLSILTGVLNEEWPDIDPQAVKCLSGNIRGEYINLQSQPNNIPYINETLRKKQTPTLIVLRESNSSTPPPPSPDSMEPQQVSRTLSNFLRGMIGGIPDPSPLPWAPAWPNTVTLDEENEEGDTNNDSYATSSVSIQIKQPSSESSSSTDTSPDKQRKRPRPIAKDTRSVSLKDTTSYVKDSDSVLDDVFLDSPPRPRAELVNIRARKTSKDTLEKLKKRNTLISFSRSVEDDPSPLDISGPEQRSFDWKARSRRAVRTTRKGNQNRPQAKVQSMPTLSYSSFEVHTITVQPEEFSSFQVKCREFETVQALKDLIYKEMRQKGLVLTTTGSKIDFTLTYEINGTVYELFNDRQLIYKTMLYAHWKEIGDTTTVPVHIDLKETSWEIPTLLRISKLSGVLLDEDVAQSVKDSSEISHLACVAKNDRAEVEWARRTLHSYVDELVRERNGNEYALSMELETDGTSTLLALQIPIDNKVEITFHYKDVFSLVRRVDVNKHISDILRDIFPCVVACGLVENEIENYTLQITGEMSYLDGPNELIAFRDIRKSILKSEPVHISVTRKPTPAEDTACSLNWLPIDPFSAEPPLHTDISRTQKSEWTHETFAASVWDQNDEFALIVSVVDKLPIPVNKETKKIQVVTTATIYHSSNVLMEKQQTTSHFLNTEGKIEFHETLLFGIETKNVPKAAKIMVCVQDESRKDKNKPANIFYWGLVPVFDHRGILQSGPYTMTLWKGPLSNSKLNHNGDSPTFSTNPCAPCNSNPDPQAVRVTVQFPRYTYPVFFPSSAPETCSFLLSQEKDSTIVRKQFEKLLSCLSKGLLPMSAFPTYIARIEWARLPQVIEVYSLLQQVEAEQALPVETALKLLDGEFADENVRGFAVRVLDTLPDEQLENFLLQLTQALKFELCHDSALGRLLLKRALKNKRIGHFFFWYLKCEMYNPLFTPRFGVLLEAYLKGCGEAMLKRFENQLEMQIQLEEIGKQVERAGGNDATKMQSVLQELLQSEGISDKILTPVYNPRIMLGKLNPAKCKIMASKKRPQWLEMCNVDPTALRPMPTRLILKLGDDLRQDVIVLRMLSLFEKLWEKEGLPDLCLIPYGCMATGPNSGFIEVVKNARTIADVSGINDNKKLYEWIRSHQKNEFGEDDPELLKEAVRRFTYSCAGYTVASYVLGIGDRHNDNIMITTGGNLVHIDFGHFLGNIKHFLGVKREWAPFVLTPDFVYVMGGENSDTFNTYKNLCCRAFLCLRRHNELIFNLFSLMRSTGIPELACVEDAQYIRDALMLTSQEHEAEQSFQQLIKKCLDLQWTVQIMWWIHKKRTGGNSS